MRKQYSRSTPQNTGFSQHEQLTSSKAHLQLQPKHRSMDGMLRRSNGSRLALKPSSKLNPSRENVTEASAAPIEPLRSPKQLDWKQEIKSMLNSPIFILVMAVIVFIAGMSVTLVGLRTNERVNDLVTNNNHRSSNGGNSEDEGDYPDENIPKTSNCNATQNSPKRITIASLGLKSCITPLGLKSNNQLKAPNNIYDTGWYKDGATLGESGVVLLDGHVSGPTKPGVFKNLHKLKGGDIITVENGQGQAFSYKVTTVKTVRIEQLDMTELIRPDEGADQGLNLITCAGKYDMQAKTFDSRTVVLAVRE